MRGRWRGGHAATDEVDVGYTLHDRRCGRCRSPSPAAACVIPCFQFSMLLHNLSSIFSLGKKVSQRAPRCTRVPHRTAATTRQPKASTTPAPAESPRQTGPDQKRAPDRTRPQARARLGPTKSARQTAPGRKPTPYPHTPLSALPHAPPRPAAARTGVCPTASTPSRAAPVHRCAPAGPRPSESTHQAARRARARPQRPERLETSFPHAFHRVFHIFAGFPQRLSFPLAFFERDRVRYALPYVPAVR